jgi:hypothetical protein
MSSVCVQKGPATKGSIRISTPSVAASSRTCSIGGSSIFAAPGSSWSDRNEAWALGERRPTASSEAGEGSVLVGGERVADGVELKGQGCGCHGFSPVRRADPMNSDQRSGLTEIIPRKPDRG